MKNKSFLFVLMFLFILLTVACQETENNDPTQITPYRIQSGDQVKPHIIDESGRPILLLASEIRLDILTYADQLSLDQLGDYFRLVSETDLNTAEVSLPWSMVENERGMYDFEVVDALFDYAVDYDLYLNIQWYGSFVDGETRTAYLPEYISEDTETYPVLADLYDFGIYGRARINDWTDDDLLEREKQAVQAVLGRFAERTEETSFQPLVMFQIGQGVDRFPRWRISQYEILENNLPMTPSSAWDKVLTYVGVIADAVKQADYAPLTRVEFTEQNAVVGYVYDIADLENVDMVAPTYLHKIANVKSGVPNFRESFPDIPIYNAQNWADDNNHRNLLAHIALGSVGYNAYPLSFARYYPEPQDGVLYSRYDPEGQTFSDKFSEEYDRVSNLRMIVNGLNKAYVAAAKTVRQNFLVLGMDNRLEADEMQKVYSKDGLFVTADLPEEALGFVLSHNDYVYIFSTMAGTVTFERATFLTASKGFFDSDGEWQGESLLLQYNNLGLDVQAQTLYRIKVQSMDELPTDIPEEYVSAYDAIRE